MNFYRAKPVIVATRNFESARYMFEGSATVLPELPDQEQVQDWHALRQRDLIFLDGEGDAEESVAKAKAMGHGRVGVLELDLDAHGDPDFMPFGLPADELLATARAAVRKTATSADVSIVEMPSAYPRPIPLAGLGTLGTLVHLAADHAATHRDFVSALVWPALSGVTGCSVVARVSGGFRQPCIVYAAIVGGPGTNKTGAFRALDTPKRAVERWAEDDHNAAMALWEIDNEGKKKAERDKPPARQLIRLSNATAEAAMFTLHQQGRGVEFQIEELAVVLPQLGVNAGGGYSNSAPLAGLWLRGFDGGRADYTRRSVSDEPLVINNFATAISVASQPDVLADFFNSPRRDGAPDRLLLAYPDDYSIEDIKGEGDADDVAEELARVWIELRRATLAMEKANDLTGDRYIEVRFDADAVLIFERWRRHLLAAAKFLSPAQQSARMKAVSQFVRIAGLSGFVRHVVDGAQLSVGAEIAHCTIDTMRGFLDHRAKTERFLAEPVRERRARELAREICMREAYTFRPSDVRREWRLPLCRDEAALRDALIELGELGWLKAKVGRGPRDPLPNVVAVVEDVLREGRDAIFKSKGGK